MSSSGSSPRRRSTSSCPRSRRPSSSRPSASGCRSGARIFVAEFPALARLHDKASFESLVRKLGLPIPETVVATSDEELADAIGRFDQYFARAVFSRGGVALLTNTGPLAGARDPADVHPTPAEPWVVQPFVEGETVCSYSTVHDGVVSSHLLYRIPRQWHHSTGIQFESTDALESLRLIEPIVAELNYTGQISFDFLEAPDGLSFVECNPRATDGLLLLDSEQLARGLLDPEADTFVLPPGETKQLELALIGDAFSDHLKRAPETIRDLARFKDAGDGWHDPLPTLYSAFSLLHFAGVSHREHAVAPERDGRGHELGRRADQRDVGRRREAARRAAERLNSHSPKAIPAQSVTTSRTSESRPSTKRWWYSSATA